MTKLIDPSETHIPSKFNMIIDMVNSKPNDMDLGKAVRQLIEEYNEAVKRPPFTDDYTQ